MHLFVFLYHSVNGTDVILSSLYCIKEFQSEMELEGIIWKVSCLCPQEKRASGMRGWCLISDRQLVSHYLITIWEIFAYGFQRYEQEMTHDRLVSQNKLNWTEFVWLQGFYLLEGIFKARLHSLLILTTFNRTPPLLYLPCPEIRTSPIPQWTCL